MSNQFPDYQYYETSVPLQRELQILSELLGGTDNLGFIDLPDFVGGIAESVRDFFFGESKSDRMARRAARQQAAFEATASGKQNVIVNRSNQSLADGEVLSHITNDNFYHLGDQRFTQTDDVLITRGNPGGAFDIQFRTAQELADNLGSKQFSNPTGVVFMSPDTLHDSAATIFNLLLGSNPQKAQDFQNAITGRFDAGDRGFPGATRPDFEGIRIANQQLKTAIEFEKDKLLATEQLEIHQEEFNALKDKFSALQDQYNNLLNDSTATQEELNAIRKEAADTQAELDTLTQEAADRQAQIDADAAQEQENQQFIIDNNLSPDHFSLSPEEQERDLFIAQSQQFLDLEASKADLLTQKQRYDALELDPNVPQADKDAQRGSLNISIAKLIQAGLAIGVPIGKILNSDDVIGAVENQPEDVSLNFRSQTPDLKISPTLGPRLNNVAGLLSGGGGFTTKPFKMSRFSPAPITEPKTTFNQFEDKFNPEVVESGFPKPKSFLNTGNSRGLLSGFKA